MEKSKMKKFYVILGVLIILLIPIGFLAGIVSGRESYKDEAISNISKSWAESQTVQAPSMTLNIPVKDDAAYKQLKPDEYNANVTISTELRKKGVFTVPVYTADVVVKGNFKNPAGNLNNIKTDLELKISDSKGFVEKPKFKLLNGNLESSNSVKYSKYITTNATNIPFEVQYKIRGMNSFNMVPDGENNKITINGNWDNPSFDGSFLPVSRTVEKNKFEAQWSIPAIANASIESPSLGVSFLTPVDNYRMATRAIKYAFLFLVLTFLAYFIFEITSKKDSPIHPLQYLMMGIAMLIFYLLLVSLSEFVPFLFAYIIATLMILSLIGMYTYFVITKRNNKAFTFIIIGIMTLLYAFLYVLLILQDLSLLFGSLGLFIIIAVIMYVTRNIDWYSENN